MLVRHCVPILFDEPIGLIRNIDSVMSNRERSVAESRFLEDVLVLWFIELCVKLLEERGVRAGR